MRAGEPETKTPAPNTGLNPPLIPNSLMPLTLTVGLLPAAAAAAAVRQLLRLAITAALACASAATLGNASTSFVDVPPGAAPQMI